MTTFNLRKNLEPGKAHANAGQGYLDGGRVKGFHPSSFRLHPCSSLRKSGHLDGVNFSSHCVGQEKLT